MKFQVEKGWCNLDLRKCCMAIAIFFILCNIMVTTSVLTVKKPDCKLTCVKQTVPKLNAVQIVELGLTTIANISLLIGAYKHNKWFVLVWLFAEMLFFIHWPIKVLGTIFGFGKYRSEISFKNYYVVTIIHVIDLALNIYFTLIVWSLYKKITKPKTSLQSITAAP